MLTIKHKTQETPAEQVIHFEAASFSFFLKNVKRVYLLVKPDIISYFRA